MVNHPGRHNPGRQKRFFCTQCSRCCRFEEGYVFLSAADLERLTVFLGGDEEETIDRYCRWVPMGAVEQLSLREQRTRDCVFWIDGGCAVYDSRPVQCRTYPFWRHIVDEPGGWEEEAAVCPGIGIGRVWKKGDINHALERRRTNLTLTRTEFSAGENR